MKMKEEMFQWRKLCIEDDKKIKRKKIKNLKRGSTNFIYLLLRKLHILGIKYIKKIISIICSI